MSRYRAPSPPSSRYISAAGAKRLREELTYLWKEERPRVTRSVADAAALGDRSENADYIYGKKRLREIDRRVRYLNKRLDDAIVVNQSPHDTSKVYFGAMVNLQDESGDILECRLLGADEIDPAKGHISIDSPMARALLGKSITDQIAIDTPSGNKRYIITGIHYQA